jgi:hypothetical protein
MAKTHRAQVEDMLADAAAVHAALLPQLPPHIRVSLPVDAPGITEAIDFVAEAAGLSWDERRTLIRPHATNAAVMHARVFGGAPLGAETIIGSFVEAASVRADALAHLADVIGGADLSTVVHTLLVEHPLPLADDGEAAIPALRDAYSAQEVAVVAIATQLDEHR